MSLDSLGIGNTMIIAAVITFIGAIVSYKMAPETNSLDLHAAANLTD